MSFRFAVRCSGALLLAVAACYGQQPVVVTPALSPAAQLKIRNLQYEQDRKLLELQRIEIRYRELQAQIKADNEGIENLVRELVTSAKVNTTLYVLDLDSLTFVSRNARPKKEPNPK